MHHDSGDDSGHDSGDDSDESAPPSRARRGEAASSGAAPRPRGVRPDPDAWVESIRFPEPGDEGAFAAGEGQQAFARCGQRLQRGSRRPLPASERPLPASERPLPASERAGGRLAPAPSGETQRVASGPERVFPSGDTARLGSRRTRRLLREDTSRCGPPPPPEADPRSSESGERLALSARPTRRCPSAPAPARRGSERALPLVREAQGERSDTARLHGPLSLSPTSARSPRQPPRGPRARGPSGARAELATLALLLAGLGLILLLLPLEQRARLWSLGLGDPPAGSTAAAVESRDLSAPPARPAPLSSSASGGAPARSESARPPRGPGQRLWPERGRRALAERARRDRRARAEGTSSAVPTRREREARRREEALHRAGGALVRVALAAGERGGRGLIRLELLLGERRGAPLAPLRLACQLSLPAGLPVDRVEAGPAALEAGATVQVRRLGPGRVLLEVRARRGLAPGRLADLGCALPDPFPARVAITPETLAVDGGPPRDLSHPSLRRLCAGPLVVE